MGHQSFTCCTASPQVAWLTHHHLLNRGQGHVVIPQEHRVCIVLHDKEKTTREKMDWVVKPPTAVTEGLTSGLGLSWGTKATLKWVQKRVPEIQPLPSRALSFFLTMTALCSTHSPGRGKKTQAGNRLLMRFRFKSTLIMGHCRLVYGVWGVKRFMDLAKHSEARIHNRKNTVSEEVQQGDWQWV